MVALVSGADNGVYNGVWRNLCPIGRQTTPQTIKKRPIGHFFILMDGDVKTSGAIFSFGLGCKQYMTNNFYLNANLSYKITTEMDIKEINGLSVDNVSERMSGF